MTKRRRQGWMLFLAGLLLLAGAWLLLRLLPGLDTTPWRAVPFLCLGVGCGLFGGGTGELLAVQALLDIERDGIDKIRVPRPGVGRMRWGFGFDGRRVAAVCQRL